MRLRVKASILIFALTSTLVSGNFTSQVLENEEISFKSGRAIEIEQHSDNYSVQVLSSTYKDDTKATFNYQISGKNGSSIKATDIMENVTQVQLYFYKEGTTDYNASTMIYNTDLIDSGTFFNSYDSEWGRGTTGLIDVDPEYFEDNPISDVYLVWKEKGSEKFYYSSSAKFKVPETNFPKMYISDYKRGYGQDLVQITVDYEEGTQPIENGDDNYFFNYIDFQFWNENSKEVEEKDLSSLTITQDDPQLFSTDDYIVYYVWDTANTKFDYYILLDNVEGKGSYSDENPSVNKNSFKITAQYNASHLSSNKVIEETYVTPESSSFISPTISYETYIPSELNNLIDYKTAYIDFVVNSDETWISYYETIYTVLEEYGLTDRIEIFPNNVLSTITLENVINNDTGDLIDISASTNVLEYDSEIMAGEGENSNGRIILNDLEPNSNYSADAVLKLNMSGGQVFDKDEVTAKIEFSTAPTIEAPTVTYMYDANKVPIDSDTTFVIDETKPINWNRDLLKFNLQSPDDWDFSSDIISAGELFDSGTIVFTDTNKSDPTPEVTANIGKDKLSNVREGENILDTTSLGIVLNSGVNYQFTLTLEYSALAQGLFNKDGESLVITGLSSTTNKIAAPTFRFIGQETIPEDKRSVYLNFEIADSLNQFTGKDDEPLTLRSTFDGLEIINLQVIEDDGSYTDVTDQVTIENLTSDELIVGNNQIKITGLETDRNYMFEAELLQDETATNPLTGWMEPQDYSIQGMINTQKGFTSMSIGAVEVADSTFNTPGSMTWETKIEIKAPKGDDNINPGLDTTGGIQSIDWELLTLKDSNPVQSGTLYNSAKSYKSGEEYTTILDITNLDPDTTYRFKTYTTYDSNIINVVNEADLIIKTGLNNTYDSDAIIAKFETPESLDAESDNYYSTLNIDVSVNPYDIIYSSQIESIDLIDPYGVTIATTDVPIDEVPRTLFTIEGNWEPGSKVDGYKLRINNNDDTNLIDDYIDVLPIEELPYLSPTTITHTMIKPGINSVDFVVSFSNANNISYAELDILDESSNSVFHKNFDNSYFDISDPQGVDVELKTPDILTQNTTYTIQTTAHHIGATGPADDVVTTNQFKTLPAPMPEDASLTAFLDESKTTTDSLTVNYSWLNNSFDNNNIERFDLILKNNQTKEVVEEKTIELFPGETGVSSYTFLNLESGMDYNLLMSYEREGFDSPIMISEINTNTKSKDNEFTSTFSLEQEVGVTNQLNLEWEYNGNYVDDAHDTATSLEYKVYKSESASGTPIYESGNVIGDVSSTGTATITDQVEVKSTYTVVETTTYTSYSYLGTNKVYDTKESQQSVTVEYVPSSIKEVSAEFINDNSIMISFTLTDIEEFEDGKSVSLSLKYEDGSYVRFVYDGMSLLGNNRTMNAAKLESTFSTVVNDNEKTYSLQLDGISANKDDVINFEVRYGMEVMRGVAKQNFNPLIDPNSLQLENVGYNRNDGSYVYEMSVDCDDTLDLQKDIAFSTTSKSNISEDSLIKVVDENYINNYNTDSIVKLSFTTQHIYISTQKSPSGNSLQFLVGRYILIKDTYKYTDAFSSLYYISDFNVKPIPEAPKPIFMMVIVALLLILLILLLIALIIYWWMVRHRRSVSYEAAINMTRRTFYAHRNNMITYGWSHKYSEYESLESKTVKELREYAKMLGLVVPYRYNKEELLNTVSLLNEVELTRVKEFGQYDVRTSEEEMTRLLAEFKVSKSSHKWIKTRMRYYEDRAKRMQEDDYEKSFKDKFTDAYVNFDHKLESLANKLKKVENTPITTVEEFNEVFYPKAIINYDELTKKQLIDELVSLGHVLKEIDKLKKAELIDLLNSKVNSNQRVQKLEEMNEEQLFEIAKEFYEEDSIKGNSKEYLLELLKGGDHDDE